MHARADITSAGIPAAGIPIISSTYFTKWSLKPGFHSTFDATPATNAKSTQQTQQMQRTQTIWGQNEKIEAVFILALRSLP